MAKSILSKAGSFIGSLFAPKTPRGKVRQAVFFVLVLLVMAGNYAHPAYWNQVADWKNARLEAANIPLRVPHFWDESYRLGLDLQGGTHLVYVADMKDIEETERAEAMSGVRDVIERRVNAFGVSEPLVQVNKSGEAWRLIVDLAGIKDIGEAIKLIGETPILEFKETGNVEPVREMTAEETKDMEDNNAKVMAEAKTKLAEAQKAPADFPAFADKVNEANGLKGLGGDLGWVKSGDDANKPLADAVKNLKNGTIAPSVVKTDDGYHILKLEEKSGKQVQASHILICYTGAGSCAVERTKDEAQQMIKDIKASVTAATFADVAKEKSDDASNKETGGDLGYFDRQTMVKPFSDAAFALKNGEISDVVETQFGYHLIHKVADKETADILYHVRDAFFDIKTSEDYLPAPDPWKNTTLSGKHLERSVLQFDPNSGEPVVSLEFNDEGGDLFAEITKRNVGKPVAIFLDGEAISTPNVNEEITGGQAVISGNFTVKEAKDLVRRLNAGALPVPVTLESQQTVGASLGKESLDKSLQAGLMGFLIVALFMLLYYRLPGIIAILALCLYTVINLALYKLFSVTLSLPGIAGFILSVGMAVDANILIFERVKEELHAGRTLSSAIDEGFKRAWNSIRDSNFTTLISCAILFYTSSSLIKGFALNLALGVLVSMFSAITVSRTLLRLVSGWSFAKNPWLYMPGLNVAPKLSEANPASGGAGASTKR